MSYTDVVSHLARTRVVAIITRRADGTRVATPIWSVALDRVPYIRSAYGEGAWWYRHVRAGRPVEFAMIDGAIAERDKPAAVAAPAERVWLEPVAADDPVQAAIDEEFWSRYADQPSSVEPIVTPVARAATLRVVAPAS